MAIRIPNKNPLEVQARNGIGIALPLNGSAIFKTTYTTKDTIKSNLINFILTNQNERVFNLNFGGNLRAQLFNQLTQDNVDNLLSNISSQILLYFPQVKILELLVTPVPDANQLKINLTYSIINGGITDNIELTFS
jgi:phage baseplate assembly protein W